MVKVLMVCLGNICRSPMAEGILRQKAKEKGLDIEVDSAGFEPYHSGDRPDKRAIATAQKHTVDITDIRSRVFEYSDFERFDYIYVMDENNYRNVMNKARNNNDSQKVDFILNAIYPKQNKIVPDPYYGGEEGFEKVFCMLENACENICRSLLTQTKSLGFL